MKTKRKYKVKTPKIHFKQSENFSQERLDRAYDYIIDQCLEKYRFEHLQSFIYNDNNERSKDEQEKTRVSHG